MSPRLHRNKGSHFPFQKATNIGVKLSNMITFSSAQSCPHKASSNQKEISEPAAAMIGCAKGPSYSANKGVRSWGKKQVGGEGIYG